MIPKLSAVVPYAGFPTSETLFGGMVARLTSKYAALWAETSDLRPEFRDHFSSRQKSRLEKEFDAALQKMPMSSEAYRAMNEIDRTRTRAKVRSLLARSLFRTSDTVTNRFFDDCDKATEAFVFASKQLDPGIPEHDIHQALRNLWVFNSIQFYLDTPVSLSPSAIAYSLLYPYTDNWLDMVGRSTQEKQSFLDWLTLRLEGKNIPAEDHHGATLTRFLQMIEEQYPRQAFPGVYHSLLAIHRAQQRGLLLHESGYIADEERLLELTLEKGGTSVLADGFLVFGELQPPHINALFGYGVLLQLIDDLQDFDEDGYTGHSTPFSRAAKAGSLDGITNRLFNFTKMIVVLMSNEEPNREAQLTRIIEQSCFLLIQEAVARYHTQYSRAYLRMVENATPMRLSYLGMIRKRLRSNRA